MLIDGKKLALKKYEKLKEKIQKLEKKPHLWVVLVGDNAASLRYIGQKKKWAEYVGMNFSLIQLPEETSEKELLTTIEQLNNDENIDGFMVQTPLPKHISNQKVIKKISPKKDVDWFHPKNLWKLMIGNSSAFVSCTPAGIMELFKSEKIQLEGAVVTVIGRSNIVWKPLTSLLINAWATVISCNSKTKDTSTFTTISDIVIVATWVPELLQVWMLKSNSVVIDVGFSVIDGKIKWDTNTSVINAAGHKITPVPGWVGPMTVCMLLENTYKACKK